MPQLKLKNAKIEIALFFLLLVLSWGSQYIHCSSRGLPLPWFFSIKSFLFNIIPTIFQSALISLSVYIIRNEDRQNFQPGHFLLFFYSAIGISKIAEKILILVINDYGYSFVTCNRLGILLTCLVAIAAILQLKNLTWWRLFFIVEMVTSLANFFIISITIYFSVIDMASMRHILIATLFTRVTLKLLIIISAIYQDIRHRSGKYDKLHWIGVFCAFAWIIVEAAPTVGSILLMLFMGYAMSSFGP